MKKLIVLNIKCVVFDALLRFRSKMAYHLFKTFGFLNFCMVKHIENFPNWEKQDQNFSFYSFNFLYDFYFLPISLNL